MKKYNSQDLVDDAVLEIQKIAPRDSHVEIEVVEDPVGHFKTNIKLTTKMKTYFSKKEDSFVYGSFSKALKAMKSQLRRGKVSRMKYQASLKNTHAY